MEDGEPRSASHGWHNSGSQAVDNCFFRHAHTQQAMMRSQSGPLAGSFIVFSSSRLTRFDACAFRVLLFRRLWRPLPLSSSACWCGRPSDERLAQQQIPRRRCGQVQRLSAEQGIIILGTQLGHDECVRAQLVLKSREHDVLLSRIPCVADLQSAWASCCIALSSRQFLVKCDPP